MCVAVGGSGLRLIVDVTQSRYRPVCTETKCVQFLLASLIGVPFPRKLSPRRQLHPRFCCTLNIIYAQKLGNLCTKPSRGREGEYRAGDIRMADPTRGKGPLARLKVLD